MDTTLSIKSTPKREYSLIDRCCLCGFSFLETTVSGSGTKVTQKQYKLKLRLNEERLGSIQEVISIQLSDFEKAVCQKCYRKVDSVKRMEKQIQEIKFELQESRNRVQQDISTTVRQKRLLRSPLQPQPYKINRFPTTVSVKHPVQLTSFLNLTTSSVPQLAPVPVTLLNKSSSSSQPLGKGYSKLPKWKEISSNMARTA